jgi:alpha-tubulin suppressor-like RCC1 family protein
MGDTSRLLRPLLFLLAVTLTGLVGVPAGAAQNQQVTRTVTLAAASSTALTSSAVSFSGKLSKSPKGSKVKLQQKRGASWTTLVTVSTTTKKGAYAAAATMPSTPGVQQFRALAPGRKVTKNGTTRKLKKAISAVVSVTVEAPPVPPVTPVIATTSLPDGEVAAAYVADLELVTAMSGTWSVAPALPTGLTLDATSGGLSGTPTADGTSNLTFSFTPTAPGSVASKGLSLTVLPEPPPPAPEITTTHLADGYAGQAYSQTLTTDDPGPGTWTQTGAPAGFAIDGTTGELSGTSAVPGDYAVVIKFTRTADGLFDEETFDLRLDTVPVPPVAAVTMDGGGRHACRVLADASLWCWGHQGKGAVGIGPVDLADVRRPEPEQVGSASWLQVSAAVENVQTFSCGIQTDRSLWCWGSASAGQLGLGPSGTQQNSPALVDDTRNWATVSGGQSHTCATTLGGRLFCWGDIATGLASGAANVPTEVDPGGSAWSSVSAGGGHTCGIRVTGTLWCWGLNSRGQLGTGGSPGASDVPVQVGKATDWTGLSAGAAHSCALRGTDLYCWGRNSVGAVGSGTPGSDVTAPAQVPGSWARVAASGSGNADHTCAIDTVGRLWCWGEGDQGRLGNGTEDAEAAPAQVGTDITWASVTAGGNFGCAVKVDNTQWCWGGNTDGEVGVDSPLTEFLTPQQVTG